MSKKWICADCECLDTDACYYGVRDGKYPACNRIVVDHNKAYQQGREDAIDELAKLIHKNINELNHHQVDFLAEQIKEQKNE